MKILLICDSGFESESTAKFLKEQQSAEFSVFSLTGNLSVLEAIKNRIGCRVDNPVEIYDSAQLISEQVKILRNKVCPWSAAIGNAEVSSKTIKDWFLLPGCSVSSWWFGLLSERNTLKTDAYFKIAQIRAIAGVIDENCGMLLVSVSDNHLSKSLKHLAREKQIPIKVLPVSRGARSESFKRQILDFLERLSWLGGVLRGLITWGKLAARGFAARAKLPALETRKHSAHKFLFVSYFPAVEPEGAKNGVFKNKYALPLQELLRRADKPVTWLLMPVPLDGYDFKGALNLAERFCRHGESLFLLDEFLTMRVAFKGLFLWLRQVLISLSVFNRIEDKVLCGEPAGIVCRPIIKSLWNLSFCGPVAVESILYTLMFQGVFRQLGKTNECLYYCEMHAWEKALNAAKKLINPRIRAIGYQHAAVSRNDMAYFYDKSETARTGKPSDLPLPDILACNGKYLHGLLSEAGYPNLIELEAIRYLYLDKVLSRAASARTGRPVLLVAGPYNKNEAMALAALVNQAFPSAEQFDIWFKGHPSMPFEEVFSELGINSKGAGYVIKHGMISGYLESVRAVIVPTSTVAMEALATGCEVLIPVFPEAMLMNPLADFDGYYHTVSSPVELRTVMGRVAGGATLRGADGYRDLIRNYWHIDPALPLWSGLLSGSSRGKHKGAKHVSEVV